MDFRNNSGEVCKYGRTCDVMIRNGVAEIRLAYSTHSGPLLAYIEPPHVYNAGYLLDK